MDIGTLTGTLVIENRANVVLNQFIGQVEDVARKYEGTFVGALTRGALTVSAAIGGITATVIALANRGSDVNDVSATFKQFAGSVENADAIMRRMGEGTKGTVTDFAAMKSASKLLAADVKLNADQFGTLSSAAFVLQNQGLGPTTEMMAMLSNALLTGRTRALELKIGKIDLTKAMQDYAASHHTTVKALTPLQELEAKRLGLLDALDRKVKAAGDVERDFGEQMEYVITQVRNWGDQLASQVAQSDHLSNAVKVFGTAIVTAFGGDSQKAIERIVYWIERFADYVAIYGPKIIAVVADIAHALTNLALDVADTYGPMLLAAIGAIYDGIAKLVNLVERVWDILPDWFKTIAKEATTALVAIEAFNLVTGLVFGTRLSVWVGKLILWGIELAKGGEALTSLTLKIGMFSNALLGIGGTIVSVLLSPITLTIAAVAALALGIRYLTGSWDFIVKPAQAAWQVLKDVWTVAGWLVDKIEELDPRLYDLGAMFRDVGAWIADTWNLNIEEARKQLGELGEKIANFFYIDKLRTDFNSLMLVLKAVRDWFVTLGEKIADFFDLEQARRQLATLASYVTRYFDTTEARRQLSELGQKVASMFDLSKAESDLHRLATLFAHYGQMIAEKFGLSLAQAKADLQSLWDKIKEIASAGEKAAGRASTPWEAAGNWVTSAAERARKEQAARMPPAVVTQPSFTPTPARVATLMPQNVTKAYGTTEFPAAVIASQTPIPFGAPGQVEGSRGVILGLKEALKGPAPVGGGAIDDHTQKVQALLKTLREGPEAIKITNDAFAKLTETQRWNADVLARLIPSIEEVAKANHGQLSPALQEVYTRAVESQVALRERDVAMLRSQGITLDYIRIEKQAGVTDAQIATTLGTTVEALQAYSAELERAKAHRAEQVAVSQAAMLREAAATNAGLASMAALRKDYAALVDSETKTTLQIQLDAIDQEAKARADAFVGTAEQRATYEQQLRDWAEKRKEITAASTLGLEQIEKDYWALVKQQTMTGTQIELDAINTWEDATLTALETAGMAHGHYADVVKAAAQRRRDALSMDLDYLRTHTKQYLNEVYQYHKRTLEEMERNSDKYSKVQIEDYREIAAASYLPAAGLKTFGDGVKEQTKLVDDLAQAFVNLAQIGGETFGVIGQTIGGMLQAYKLALDSFSEYQERRMRDLVRRGMSPELAYSTAANVRNLGPATALFDVNASAGERWQSGLATAATLAQGAASVWEATSGEQSKGKSALKGAASGAMAGMPFAAGTMGLSVVAGAIGGAIVGWVRGVTDYEKAARQAGKDFDNLLASLKEANITTEDLAEAAATVGLEFHSAMLVRDPSGDDVLSKSAELKAFYEELQQRTERLNTAMDQYGVKWTDLGNAAKASNVHAVTKDLLANYEALTSAGMDPSKVIKAMAPALNAYVQEVIRAGQTIPGEMRPILEQLVKMNALTNETFNIMSNTAPTVAIDELVKRSDAKVEAFKTKSAEIAAQISDLYAASAAQWAETGHAAMAAQAEMLSLSYKGYDTAAEGTKEWQAYREAVDRWTAAVGEGSDEIYNLQMEAQKAKLVVEAMQAAGLDTAQQGTQDWIKYTEAVAAWESAIAKAGTAAGNLTAEQQQQLDGLLQGYAGVQEAATKYDKTIDPSVKVAKLVQQNAEVTAKISDLYAESSKKWAESGNAAMAAETEIISLNFKGYDTAAAGTVEWQKYREAVDRWNVAVGEGADEVYNLSLEAKKAEAVVKAMQAKGMDTAQAGTQDWIKYKDAVAKWESAVAKAGKTAGNLTKEQQQQLEALTTEYEDINNLLKEYREQMEKLTDESLPALDDIRDAADRYGITLDDLGGKVKQLEINELAAQYVADWELLSGVTDNWGMLFDKMGPKVQSLVLDAIKYQAELPMAMQPMLQAFIDAGELVDENGEKLTDLSKLTFAKDLSDMFEDLMTKLDEFIDKIGNGVVPALTGLGNVKIPGIEIPVHYKTAGEPPEVEEPVHAATGGVVVPFRPRGTDVVPAMLTPGERILTAQENMQYEVQASGGGGTVIVELDRRLIAKAAVPTLPGALKRLGVR